MSATFACSDCHAILPTKEKLSKHSRVHKTHVRVQYSPTQSETVPKQPNGRYYCNYCKQFDTSSPSLMQKHGQSCLNTTMMSPKPSTRSDGGVVSSRSHSVVSLDSVRSNNSTINLVQHTQASQPAHSIMMTKNSRSTSITDIPLQTANSNESLSITTAVLDHGKNGSSGSSINAETSSSTPSSDNQSDIIDIAESTFASMPLTEDVYAKYQPFIGLVVHIPSGATICLHCKKCFLLSSVVGHFMSFHKLNQFIKKYNQALEGVSGGKKIILNEIQSELMALGAKHYSDLDFYVCPTQAALPVIEVLPVLSGYMCSYCPMPGTTSTAFFGSKLTTMKNHHLDKHKGIVCKERPVECYIQHLYSDQAHFKYFRVERFYQGPTITSTITTEGNQRYQAFLQANPSFHEPLDPSTMVKDNRVQSKFYSKVNWFGLADIVTDGDDTATARILLHDWVCNLHKSRSDRISKLDCALETWVRKYFYYVQDILNDSTMSVYYERCKVMHDDKSKPFPTEGLGALTKATCDRYADNWFKYVKMLLLGATDSLGRHSEGAFRRFGKKVLNGSILSSTIKFGSDIVALLDGVTAENEDAMATQILPVLHTYFLEIASEETPKSREMFKSSFTVFSAFRQIGYQGEWKSVRNIKATPIMLKYAIRSIVFLDMLLEKGELRLDGDIDMAQVNRMTLDHDFWPDDDMSSSDSCMED